MSTCLLNARIKSPRDCSRKYVLIFKLHFIIYSYQDTLWKDKDIWQGYFETYPDYMPQDETLEAF